MASSNYRMNVIWSSHGAQLRRDMNAFMGQFNQMGQQMDRHSRRLSLWGQQMRAVGTTIRYALAGATIYAVASAVSSLGEFENKLGLIDSLAGRMQGGKFEGLGQSLEKIGDRALLMSNKFGIAVDDIQQHMVAFYSSFQAPEGKAGIDQLNEFTQAMARLTLVSEGADPAGLARGLASASRDPKTGQLPKGRADEVASAISFLIGRSTIIRGEDIVRDLGRLTQGATAANMSLEDVLGVYLQASLGGGSAAVVGRGTAQLFRTEITQPQTKEQIKAFRQAVGTADPTALHQLGGLEILKRLSRAVAPRGLSLTKGQQTALTSEDVESGDIAGATAGKGINLTLAHQLFGRQESLGVFLTLLAQGGPEAMRKHIKSVEAAEEANANKIRADQVNERRWFQQMRESQRNLGISTARGLEPFLRPLSRGVRGVSNVAVEHPTGTVAAIGGVAAAQVVAKLAFGMGIGGLIGKGMARIPGMSKLGLGGLATRAPAFAAAQLVGGGIGSFQATGIGELGAGKRTNPLWVVIDPQSWFFPGAPSGSAVPGGTTTDTGGRAGGAGRFVPLVAGRLLGPLSIAALLSQTPGAGGFRPGFNEIMQESSKYPRLQRLYALRERVFGLDNEASTKAFFGARGVQRAIGMAGTPGTRGFHPERAEKFLKNVESSMRRQGAGTPFFAVEGEGVLTVKIETTEELRRFLRAVAPAGMPVTLIPQARPTSRGKPSAPRRDRPG